MKNSLNDNFFKSKIVHIVNIYNNSFFSFKKQQHLLRHRILFHNRYYCNRGLRKEKQH
jgi:hypothetical protein